MDDSDCTIDETPVPVDPFLNSYILRDFFSEDKAPAAQELEVIDLEQPKNNDDAECSNNKQAKTEDPKIPNVDAPKPANHGDILKEFEIKVKPEEDLKTLEIEDLCQQSNNDCDENNDSDTIQQLQEIFTPTLSETDPVASETLTPTLNQIDTSASNDEKTENLVTLVDTTESDDNFDKSYLNIFGEEIAIRPHCIGIAPLNVSNEEGSLVNNNNVTVTDRESTTSSNDTSKSHDDIPKLQTSLDSKIAQNHVVNSKPDCSDQLVSTKIQQTQSLSSAVCSKQNQSPSLDSGLGKHRATPNIGKKVNLKIETEGSIQSLQQSGNTKLKAEALWHDGSLRVILRGPAHKVPPLKNCLEKSESTPSVPVDVQLHFVPQKASQVSQPNVRPVVKRNGKDRVKTKSTNVNVIESRAAVNNSFDTRMAPPSGRLPFSTLYKHRLKQV